MKVNWIILFVICDTKFINYDIILEKCCPWNKHMFAQYHHIVVLLSGFFYFKTIRCLHLTMSVVYTKIFNTASKFLGWNVFQIKSKCHRIINKNLPKTCWRFLETAHFFLSTFDCLKFFVKFLKFCQRFVVIRCCIKPV